MKVFVGVWILMALCSTGFGQTTVTVADGTNDFNLPINPNKAYTYSQSLYPQSWINYSGTVSQIQLKYYGTAWTDNVVIYLGHTTKTSFSSATDWVGVGSMTQVYSGGLTTVDVGGWTWITITLDVPFTYNNSNNLVLAIDENTAGSHNGTDQFGDYVLDATDRSLSYENDATNPDPASPPSGGSNFRVSSLKLVFSSYDADIQTPASQVAGTTISSLVDTQGEAQSVFSFKVTDNGADGINAKPTKFRVIPGVSNTADWTDHIQGVRLHDGTDYISIASTTINDSYIDVNITEGDVLVTDNTSKTFTLYVYLNTGNIADGSVLSFKIDADNHGCTFGGSGSLLLSTVNSGTDITSNNFTIDVIATILAFTTTGRDVYAVKINTNFTVSVKTKDANGNIDLGENGSITLGKNSGSGTISSATGLTQNLASGLYTWSDVQYDTEGLFKLQVTHGSLPTIITGNMDCWDANLLVVSASSGDYTSLESAYGILSSITNKYVITILDDYAPGGETYPIEFGSAPAATATNTIRIIPHTDCTAKTFTYGASGFSTIYFNNADYVTIDGRPRASGNASVLTVQHTNTISNTETGAFLLKNGSTNNTVKYCNIQGCASGEGESGSVFKFDDGGNADNTIQNCIFSDYNGNLPSHFVNDWNSDVSNSSSITITGCEFKNFARSAIYVEKSDTWTITNNHFYQTSSLTGHTTYHSFIAVAKGGGHTITGNYLGGQATNCGGGVYTVSSNNNFHGIYFTSGTSGSVNVLKSNTIANISFTTTGTASPGFVAIESNGSNNYTIGATGESNVIGATSGTANITFTNNGTSAIDFMAFNSSSSGTTTISYNTVGAITINGSNTNNGNLLYHDEGTLTANDNTFGNTTPNNIVLSPDCNFYGVFKNSASSNMTIQSNTFQNFDLNHTTKTFGCVWMGNQTGGTMAITGNIFKDINSDGKFYGIYAYQSGGAPVFTLTSNQIGSTSNNNITLTKEDIHYGIYCGNNPQITSSGNVIQEFNITNTGSGTGFIGIYLWAGTVSLTTDTIREIDMVTTTTTAGNFTGIYVYNATITANKYQIKNLNSLTTGAVDVKLYGIYVNTSWPSGTFQKGDIQGLKNTATGTNHENIGIYIGASATNNWNFYNNVVLCNNGASGESPIIAGIKIEGTGINNVYHNSVKIYGAVTNGANISACMLKSSASGTLNIKNNVWQNLRTGGGSHFAVYINNAGGTNNIDYNFLQTSAAPIAYWTPANQSSIADWRTASSASAFEIDGSITMDAAGYSNDAPIKDVGVDLTPTITDEKGDLARDASPWIGAWERAASPLPVVLINFAGKCLHTENIILLKWTTSSEINNDFFTLERSVLTGNLQEHSFSWNTIAVIDGAGNSNSILSYSYADNSFNREKTNYYRLKQTDFDGRFSYSPIISAKPCNTNFANLIYPNPSNGNITLEFFSNKEYEELLNIYDVAGKLVEKRKLIVMKGLNQFYINLENLRHGYYFISNPNETEWVRQIIVIN